MSFDISEHSHGMRFCDGCSFLLYTGDWQFRTLSDARFAEIVAGGREPTKHDFDVLCRTCFLDRLRTLHDKLKIADVIESAGGDPGDVTGWQKIDWRAPKGEG